MNESAESEHRRRIAKAVESLSKQIEDEKKRQKDHDEAGAKAVRDFVETQAKAEEEVRLFNQARMDAERQAAMMAFKEQEEWLSLMNGFISLTDIPASIIAQVVDDLRRLGAKPKDALPAFKVAHDRWLEDERRKAATRPEAYGSWA